MRITVDLSRCESHGQCVFAAPDVFSFDADDQLLYVENPDDARDGDVETAVASCPLQAITILAPAP